MALHMIQKAIKTYTSMSSNGICMKFLDQESRSYKWWPISQMPKRVIHQIWYRDM